MVAVGLFLLLLWLPLSGCSSVPDERPPEGRIKGQAQKYVESGNALYGQARFAEALDMYQLALDRYIRIDDLAGSARAYNAIGSVYQAIGREAEAEELFRRALHTVRPPGTAASDELSPEETAAAAAALGNLAEVAYGRDTPDDALAFIARGLELAAGDGYPAERAVLLHNRGTIRKRQGELNTAREDLLRALELNRKQQRYGEMATNHYMLGSIALQRGNPEEAREHLLRALELDRRMEHSIAIVYDLRALAEIAEVLGEEARAREYARRAAQIYESLGLAGETAVGEESRR
jgi:tetratricopeptide (TPR) repeat protein